MLYRKTPHPREEIPKELDALMDAVCFYQGAAPFGFIGSTILDNQQVENHLFCMKHDYLVHTLEDEILYQLLQAIREHRQITITNISAKNSRVSQASFVPLKILSSAQTGRRYVCMRLNDSKRFNHYRLDCISNVEPGEPSADYERFSACYSKNQNNCWGVSFGHKRVIETLTLTLTIHEKTESFIINRLQREGRGGTVTKVTGDTYQYVGQFYDCTEMLPWVKSFTGRILKLECSNPLITQKFYRDMDRMARMYGGE